MADDARPNAGGRKPDPSKDRAIVVAARQSFYERGFGASTIEDIAHRANVSKVTVYKRFTDKETLFEAVVTAEVEVMEAAFHAIAAPSGPIEQRLNAFGRTLLTFLVSAEHVALERVLGNELVMMPNLAHRFYDAGPGYCITWLAGLLEAAQAQGEIVVDNPVLAANDLLALWCGLSGTELRFGVVDGFSRERVDLQVRRGTRLFLRIFQAA